MLRINPKLEQKFTKTYIWICWHEGMAVESGPLMHAAIAAIYCMRPFSLFIHPAAIFIVQGLFKNRKKDFMSKTSLKLDTVS